MTNREKYKEAFSVLQTSRDISLEVENMANMKRKHKMNLAFAAFAACILVGGSVTAYAADVGGIQEIFSAWINGQKVTVSVKDNADENGYTFSYNNEGTEVVWGGGGVAIDENGNEEKLTAQDIMAEYSDTPQVDTDDEGRVWIYLKDQSGDITDLFDGNGVCRVSVIADGITHYVKVTRDKDGSYPYESTTDVPEEGKELYTPIDSELRIHID